MVPEVIRLPKVGVCACGQLVPRGERAGYARSLDQVVCLECLQALQSGPRRRLRVARETFEVVPHRVGPPAGSPSTLVSASSTSSTSATPNRTRTAMPNPELTRAARREQTRTWRDGVLAGGSVGRLLPTPFGLVAHAPTRRRAGTVAATLADAPEVLVLHDRGQPGRRATIDHIAIGPAGVYVVDIEDVGRRTVSQKGSPGATTPRPHHLVIGTHEEDHLLVVLEARVAIVRAALHSAGLADVPVLPVLCCIQTGPTLVEKHLHAGTDGETHVVGPKGLGRLVSTPGTLDEQQRQTLWAVLDVALPQVDRALRQA